MKIGDRLELGALPSGTRFRTVDGGEGVAGACLLEPDEVVEVIEVGGVGKQKVRPTVSSEVNQEPEVEPYSCCKIPEGLSIKGPLIVEDNGFRTWEAPDGDFEGELLYDEATGNVHAGKLICERIWAPEID